MNRKKYCSIILGAGILAFGIYNIHSRCSISEGGVLGLSLFLYQFFSISPGISNLLMDAAAIGAGTLILKRTFLWDSIAASVCYTLWYCLLECFPPILPNLSASPAIAAILGGLFVGIGTALIVGQGCAAGADDSLALIFNRLTGIHLSLFYLLNDILVLLLSLSYIPIRQIIWSLLSVTISSAIIELLKGRI